MRTLLTLLAVNVIALGCAYVNGNSVGVLACVVSTIVAGLAAMLRFERDAQDRALAMLRHPAGKGL